MKKLIFAISMAISIIANAEMIDVIEKDNTGKTVTNRYDAIEYAQKISSQAQTTWKYIPKCFGSIQSKSVRLNCDEILSSGKIFSYQKNMFPKCSKNVDIRLLERLPSASELIKMEHDDMYYQIVSMIDNLISHKYLIEHQLKNIIQRTPTYIKVQLRKEGKSFIEKDGINPVQERVNMLTKAFNAKRLSGLNDAMKACGIDCNFDIEALLLPESKITELCDKIYSGEIEFNKTNQNILRTHLGVEEYNAFVKKYNGND